MKEDRAQEGEEVQKKRERQNFISAQILDFAASTVNPRGGKQRKEKTLGKIIVLIIAPELQREAEKTISIEERKMEGKMKCAVG